MLRVVIFLCCVLGVSQSLFLSDSQAASSSPFTATAVQTIPNGPTQKGRIFVSGVNTRFEFTEHGRDVIQIILPEQRLMRILFPKDKVYMEIAAPDDAPMSATNSKTPCPMVEIMTCKKVGMDKFGELDVERWSQSIKDVKGDSTLWWEPKRKMIVRQEYADGRILQLQYAEKMVLNGRETEHWVIAIAQPGEQVVNGSRYLDTELGIVVKELSPSGMVRELRDLKAVQADPNWFAVPQGFQRIEPPKPQQLPKQ